MCFILLVIGAAQRRDGHTLSANKGKPPCVFIRVSSGPQRSRGWGGGALLAAERPEKEEENFDNSFFYKSV